MKLFASWSGGKDCMLATYRIITQGKHQLAFLLNMIDDEGIKSRSHGLNKELIRKQAEHIGIPIIQQSTNFESYEKKFKEAIIELKKQGVEGGVFGDIYLEAHRVWINRVCADLGIVAIFPLWGENTELLLKEFINTGFKTITVAINTKKLAPQWLGRIIDNDFYNDIIKLENIDACAEQGEYHSFVFDGPIFSSELKFAAKEGYNDGDITYLTIE